MNELLVEILFNSPCILMYLLHDQLSWRLIDIESGVTPIDSTPLSAHPWSFLAFKEKPHDTALITLLTKLLYHPGEKIWVSAPGPRNKKNKKRLKYKENKVYLDGNSTSVMDKLHHNIKDVSTYWVGETFPPYGNCFTKASFAWFIHPKSRIALYTPERMSCLCILK